MPAKPKKRKSPAAKKPAGASPAQATSCPVTAYALAVVAGTIVAGRLVRLACERHLRDLKDGHKRGLRWDQAAADRAIKFFSLLRLDGDKPFILQSWQCFLVGSLDGWKLVATGCRRYRTAYVETGKGSGKSPLAGGLGLKALIADRKPAAEVYAAASTMDQAGILFRDARNMALASPALAKHLEIGLHNIAHLASASFFRPLSADAAAKSGPRVHCGLIDEIHEHYNAEVVDKLSAGTKGDPESLIFEITNSGYDRNTVCWQHREYSVKILEGVLEDDSWFAYVCQLDCCEPCRAAGQTQPGDNCPDCDHWDDETKWIKANPNLEVSITLDYLRKQVREAKGMPTKEGIVKRLNFCIWTEGMTHAIPMDKWDACARKLPAETDGLECFAGLDLGAISDLTAFIRLFPHDDAETVEIPYGQGDDRVRAVVRRSYTMRATFWLPERARRRDERMQNIIDGWKRKGFIRTTPGEIVDYDVVLADILELDGKTPIIKLAIDYGFQGVHLATKLTDAFGADKVVAFRQGIVSMNSPFRELIELLICGRLQHDGDPVLRWMASNTVAEERGGLIKPSKENSREKIDGITAAVMAMGVGMAETLGSVYEGQGLDFV